ncbi:MAG: hypothetical protein WBW16_03005 [Bacteroidota bacterium]
MKPETKIDMRGIDSRKLTALQLSIVLSGGNVKLPTVGDSEFFGSTKDVAELLDVTPQRVNQYVSQEGLPKFARDKFYLPEVVNWSTVKTIADILEKKPQEMEHLGLVDFTLGLTAPLELNVDGCLEKTKKRKTRVPSNPQH